MSGINLRPYQDKMILDARELFKQNKRSALMVLPTGGGKTALTAHMIGTSASKGMSSIFIVHRRELILQSAKAFDKQGLDYGVISSGFPFNPNKQIQIASIQTLSRRINLLKQAPSLVVFDEAHHLAAKNWTKIYKHFDSSYKIGLTATPYRLDGQGLHGYFNDMVVGPSMSELINLKYLSDYKLFAPTQIDLSNVHSRMGDYVNKEIAELVDQPKFTGNAINEYKKHLENKRAVVFCVNIEHSKHVCDEFNASGIAAEHVDGSDDTSFRSGALERFDRGQTKVLCNVDLFGEGFDLPSIEGVILLRPTKSLSLYMQQVGRALRPSPGKTHAIIIDHVRNCETHGLPDDVREWSLDGIKKRDSSQECPIRVCPSCYAAIRINLYQCPECEHQFQVNKKEFDLLNSSTHHALSEVNKSKFKKKGVDVEKAKALTRDELLKIAIQRGYKKPHGWVYHMMQARQRKKLNK